jgi:hypothetical protein
MAAPKVYYDPVLRKYRTRDVASGNPVSSGSFKGTCDTHTDPGIPTADEWWSATEVGIYPGFGNVEVTTLDEVFNYLKWDNAHATWLIEIVPINMKLAQIPRVVDGVWDLNVSKGLEIEVRPYTARKLADPGFPYFYTGAYDPTYHNRLNLDGDLYVTKLFAWAINMPSGTPGMWLYMDAQKNIAFANAPAGGVTPVDGIWDWDVTTSKYQPYAVKQTAGFLHFYLGTTDPTWNNVSRLNLEGELRATKLWAQHQNQVAVYGYSSSSYGVQAVSYSNYGLYAVSSTNYALYAQSGTVPILAESSPVSRNIETGLLTLKRRTSGNTTGQNGIGAFIGYDIQTNHASYLTTEAGRLVVKLSDVTHAAEKSQFELWLKNAGELTCKFSITESGVLNLPAYTASKWLVLDSAKNVVGVDNTHEIPFNIKSVVAGDTIYLNPKVGYACAIAGIWIQTSGTSANVNFWKNSTEYAAVNISGTGQEITGVTYIPTSAAVGDVLKVVVDQNVSLLMIRIKMIRTQ